MTRKDLKVQLFAKGITNRKLAQLYKCSEQFVSNFLNGKPNFNSQKLESFIIGLLAS